MDLDDVKDVNDGFGNGSGDHVLVEVTRRIQRCLRAADTSIGFVTTREAAGADILLRNADIALYTATSEGKGRAIQYRSVLHDRVMQRVQMEAGLRRAQEPGAFRLQYQPILTVVDRQLTGVEALVRWHDPIRGVVGPDDFIPRAEATGLILPIRRWVLWEACRQMVAWRASHPHLGRFYLAVKVSARQLAIPGCVAEVEAALSNSGLPPGQLVLEVTETTVIRDIEAVAVRLGELRGLGVRIAIDDFGTGNSSLAQLRRLPVDILKIDRTFLHQLTASPAGAAVVQTVVDLGRALQLRMVAEGVETADQAREVAALSDDGRVQGFFFCRPLDPADLEALDLGSAPASSARPERLWPRPRAGTAVGEPASSGGRGAISPCACELVLPRRPASVVPRRMTLPRGRSAPHRAAARSRRAADLSPGGGPAVPRTAAPSPPPGGPPPGRSARPGPPGSRAPSGGRGSGRRRPGRRGR